MAASPNARWTRASSSLLPGTQRLATKHTARDTSCCSRNRATLGGGNKKDAPRTQYPTPNTPHATNTNSKRRKNKKQETKKPPSTVSFGWYPERRSADYVNYVRTHKCVVTNAWRHRSEQSSRPQRGDSRKTTHIIGPRIQSTVSNIIVQ